MASIVFIGAGNLACSIAPALQKAGHTLLQVYSRTAESASMLAHTLGCPYTTALSDIFKEADFYIYALRDIVYPMPCVSQQGVHLITSGSIPMSALLSEQPIHAGIFYPFQSFSKSQPITDLSQVPILIEASDNESLSDIEELACSISTKVYHSTADSRAHLHLAGVLANNFSNCLYALAEEQLQKSGLPFDVLLPLIDETARKVHHLSPREAQTGPAVRGDKEVMQKQIEMLNTEEKKQLYQLLSDDILRHRS